MVYHVKTISLFFIIIKESFVCPKIKQYVLAIIFFKNNNFIKTHLRKRRNAYFGLRWFSLSLSKTTTKTWIAEQK